MAPTPAFRWLYTDTDSGLLVQTPQWCDAAEVLPLHPDALPVPWSVRYLGTPRPMSRSGQGGSDAT
jgi:hypothetical protein